MTPDPALAPLEETGPILQPSTAGMTSKVVKGSLWTLGGSVLPLAVSFVSTPFIIRFLGSESYGVLLLVGLIPTYFSFADFGMGIASTKFASEAYGEGDRVKEVEVVWTAMMIAFLASLVVAIPIFTFASRIVAALNVPQHLLPEASSALRLAAVAFVLGILGSVVNSPMLARLRMDLNVVTAAVPKILLAAVTPFILYYGGGIVGAISWAFIVSIATLAVVVYFSGRLLPEIFRAGINRDLIRPLLKFGGAWFAAMVAAMLLINLEKLFLTKMVSVKALAYYSVAFTFAYMATMFSQAMTQSLIPAFSQLQSPEKRDELEALFARSIRLNMIWLLPALMGMFVIAKPFFTLWAGEEFGRESTLPFYILLAGLLFCILAFIPHSAIIASGRTDVFAPLYWIELVLYAFCAWQLIYKFGIVGAAAAWSIRVTLDSLIIISLSKRVAKIEFKFLEQFGVLAIGLAIIAIPIVLTFLSFPFLIIAFTALVATLVYFYFVWSRFIEVNEKRWLIDKYRSLRFRST